MGVSIALVHYPVLDKNGRLVATSITNFDIHDLARTAKTFGVWRFYLVNPIPAQQWFARRIIYHWKEGFGAQYNPTRQTAVELVTLVDDLGQISEDTFAVKGSEPVFVATSAKQLANRLTFAQLRDRIRQGKEEFCIAFGTGWGLHPSLLEDIDIFLEPIQGVGEYNHLSVRAAAAIILDRLLGGAQSHNA
jgi:hypothetical protein